MPADPLLSLRPVFVGWVALTARLWLAGYTGAVCGALGSMLTTLLYRIDVGVPGFVAFSAFGFCVAPIGILLVTKLSYARTEYRFYADRLEYEKGYFIIDKKVLMFRDVREVTLTKSVSQRMYDLGTIELSTLASDVPNQSSYAKFGFGSGAPSGASLPDIADPDRAFAAIQKLVDAARDAAGKTAA